MQGGADRLAHVVQLPTDLGIGSIVAGGQSCGLGGVGGSTQGVGSHVRDTRRLGSGPGRGDRSRAGYSTGCAAGDEALADLACGVQLTTAERPGTGDRVRRMPIRWRLGFEQGQRALGAVCSPQGNRAAVGLAECLR